MQYWYLHKKAVFVYNCCTKNIYIASSVETKTVTFSFSSKSFSFWRISIFSLPPFLFHYYTIIAATITVAATIDCERYFNPSLAAPSESRSSAEAQPSLNRGSQLSISQPSLDSEAEWNEYIDTTSKQRYWVHRERGTSTWVKPEGSISMATIAVEYKV